MALTTVVRGRAYDWSHAIGRGAATGTGFNYIQTMCLGNNGDLYTANRGNENNFGMRVNRIQLGGAGEEELMAEFFPGTEFQAPVDGTQSLCSIDKARRLLGWEPQHSWRDHASA